MRKADRLFQLVNLIGSHQPITAEQLAERIGVSVRTIFAASLDDRTMIESQIGEVPNTTEGCNVPTDEPSLRFRRWYYRAVKNKRTEAIQGTSAH